MVGFISCLVCFSFAVYSGALLRLSRNLQSHSKSSVRVCLLHRYMARMRCFDYNSGFRVQSNLDEPIFVARTKYDILKTEGTL